ncbi:uncharacterized protein PS065_011553 [Dugong dugon]
MVLGSGNDLVEEADLAAACWGHRTATQPHKLCTNYDETDGLLRLLGAGPQHSTFCVLQKLSGTMFILCMVIIGASAFTIQPEEHTVAARNCQFYGKHFKKYFWVEGEPVVLRCPQVRSWLQTSASSHFNTMWYKKTRVGWSQKKKRLKSSTFSWGIALAPLSLVFLVLEGIYMHRWCKHRPEKGYRLGTTLQGIRPPSWDTPSGALWRSTPSDFGNFSNDPEKQLTAARRNC